MHIAAFQELRRRSWTVFNNPSELDVARVAPQWLDRTNYSERQIQGGALGGRSVALRIGFLFRSQGVVSLQNRFQNVGTWNHLETTGEAVGWYLTFVVSRETARALEEQGMVVFQELFSQTGTTSKPPNSYVQHPHQHHQHRYSDHQKPCRNSFRKGPLNPTTTIDIGFSDDTTDTQSYDYYYQDNGFQHSPLRESRNTDVTFSDDSGSTRLPYFEFDDESNKRYSRNTFSERGSKRPKISPDRRTNQVVFGKDLRKVYPNQDSQWDQLYQEIQTPCDNVPVPNVPKRIPTRMSDRPHSSVGSVTSAIAIVHGCGGKCQTFENVCYFFLQLVFTMGILIGVSLCIAGIVLRKSAARNLQVLVYIGVLLALVSSLLLGIQCNARITARKRRNAIQMAKRAPIQMENLHLRTNPLHQQPLMTRNSIKNQRIMHLPQVHSNLTRPLPSRPTDRDSPSMIEEPGIPWWRRKDLNTH